MLRLPTHACGRLPVRSLHRQALSVSVRQRSKPCRASAAAQDSQGSLDMMLSNMRRAIACTGDELQEASVSGIGRHLGINISWHIHFRSDGAFVEEINGKVLNFLWGFDGRPDSSCWEVDTSGVSRSLQFDDHEAVLISTWVRTGTWLRPHITERLELELEPPRGGQKQGLESSGLSGWQLQQQKEQLGRSSSSSSSSSLSSIPPLFTDLEPGPREASIRVKLKGGRLVNTMRVCTDSWVVLSLQQPQCGDLEVWHFGAWTPWTEDMRVFFPSDLIHQAAGGGRHVYKVQECSTQPRVLASGYQLPLMPLLPNDTTYDASIPDAVPVWRSFSGHLLVRPLINGKDSGGYMILDTGASGFVITHTAAVELGLASFGELFAASISGKVQTQFVRANTWSLGPLTICQPVMMTMVLDGLVRGGPTDGDLIGIIGYDVFRRAVVQLPQMCDSGVMEPLHLEDECATTEMEHATASQPAGSPTTREPQAAVDGATLASGSPSTSTRTQGHAGQSIGGSSSSSGSWGCGSLAGSGTQGGESSDSGSSRSSVHAQTAEAGSKLSPSSNGGSSSSSSSSSSGSMDANAKEERQASSGHASSSTARTLPTSSSCNYSNSSSINSGTSSGTSGHHTGSRGGVGGVSRSQSRRSGSRTKRRRSPSPAPGFAKKGCPEYTMRLWGPGAFPEECAREWQWHTISMISNLPHLEVSFMSGSNTRTKALLMLDTGACGADIMLHARAIEELQLGELGRSTTQYMRGVGGTNNTRVDVADLPWIELAGVRCHNVRCLYARGISGLDISTYSAGIIGGDLMSRFEFIVDYARRRLGVRKRFLREADAV